MKICKDTFIKNILNLLIKPHQAMVKNAFRKETGSLLLGL